MRAAIVGGSIVGCAAAHALRRIGCDVVVLERSEAQLRTRGQGLVLPASLIERLCDRGYVSESMPTIRVRRRHWIVKDGGAPLGRLVWVQEFAVTTVSWGALFAELRARVGDADYHAGRTVVRIDEADGRVLVVLDDGGAVSADIALAADGYRSQVRQSLFPDAPLSHTGYVIWRGWLDEAHCSSEAVRAIGEHMNTFGFRRGHGNIWVIPGQHSAAPGQRQIAWNVYDSLVDAPFRDELLAPDGSLRSLPPGDCGPHHLGYLIDLARRSLPLAVAEAIEATAAPIVTPVFDVRAPALSRGGIALLGDAGMVLRPVTGSGATKSLDDTMTLADVVAAEIDPRRALRRFDQERRPVAERLVALGETMGSALVTEAPDWQSMSSKAMEAWHDAMMRGQRWYALAEADR